MRKLLVPSILCWLFCVPMAASGQSSPPAIQGTWRLISSKGSINDMPINQDSSSVYMLKILTPSRFVNTVYDKKRNHFQSTAQGTYAVAGNLYSETITHSSVGGFAGHRYTYGYTLTGNVLTIQGESNGMKISESWQRME